MNVLESPWTTIFRHLLAIAALPFTVTILVPVWIARKYAVHVAAPSTVAEGLLLIPGIGFLLAGLALFTACLLRFATRGRGTLAPWDPPRSLVVSGPYRFVRNPMISGVIFILFGEALFLRSLPHATWAVAFAGFNLLYIPLLEEPLLEARFGDAYRRYRSNVPRILPRLHPWSGENETSS